MCLEPKIDSALAFSDKKWLLFKEFHYFEVGLTGLSLRSPRKIKWDFPDFNTTVDASLFWKGCVFLFKDNQYWKYRDHQLIKKQTISQGFPGVTDGPFNDVIQWNVNQKLYFFKNGQFWKYDAKKSSVPKSYPKRVSDYWKGVPDTFDAVLSSRFTNQTYFFKDSFYYKFDDIMRRVVNDSKPPYPRNINILITKCRHTLYNIQNCSLEMSPVDFFSNNTSTVNAGCSCSSGGEIFILVISILVAIIAFILFFVWKKIISDEQQEGQSGQSQQDTQDIETDRLTHKNSVDNARSDIYSDEELAPTQEGQSSPRVKQDTPTDPPVLQEAQRLDVKTNILKHQSQISNDKK